MNNPRQRHSLSRLFTLALLVLTATVVVQTANARLAATSQQATTHVSQGEQS